VAKLNRKTPESIAQPSVTKLNRRPINFQPVPVKRPRGRIPGTKQGKAEKIPLQKLGRPQAYKQETADLICELIAQGIPLTRICRMEGMPSYPSVMAWIWRESPYKEAFLNDYKIARDAQADYWADEMVEIADSPTRDSYIATDAKGKPYIVSNGEYVQRSRLRVDTRKWIASKLKPKKYGDKLEASLSDPDGNSLIPKATTIVLDFSGQ
jgi:hypothetical protein